MDPLQPDKKTSVPPPPSGGLPQTVADISTQDSKIGNRSIIRVVIVAIIHVLVLGGVFSGAAYAVAYEKIDIKNEKLQNDVSNFVMGLPFTPKTPEFVLKSAANAHTKVSKHAFDVSLSAKSEGGASVLGFSQIDIAGQGKVDYSDPKNLKFFANTSFSKEFNLDIRKIGKLVYFRINKVPSVLVEMFKIDKEKLAEISDKWVEYDTSPLNTEASRELEKVTEEKSPTAEYLANLISDLLNEKLFPLLEMKEEELDGQKVFRIHLVADDKTVDQFINLMKQRSTGNTTRDLNLNSFEGRPSDYIKELDLELFVDKNSYFISKVITKFKYNPNYSGGSIPTQVLGITSPQASVPGDTSPLISVGQQTYVVAAVAKFDGFGENFEIEKPNDASKIEEFYAKLFATSGAYSVSGDPVEITKRSRDATRLSDLANLQMAINITAQDTDDLNTKFLCPDTVPPCAGDSTNESPSFRNPDGSGWVKVNLNNQKAVTISSLPIDPLNNETYRYLFASNAAGDGWEINTVLESNQHITKMQTDGGDNPNAYEVGSDLSILK